MTGTLLVKNADVLVTMDTKRREMAGDLFIRDGVIEAVGQTPQIAGQIVDATGCVVTPCWRATKT